MATVYYRTSNGVGSRTGDEVEVPEGATKIDASTYSTELAKAHAAQAEFGLRAARERLDIKEDES